MKEKVKVRVGIIFLVSWLLCVIGFVGVDEVTVSAAGLVTETGLCYMDNGDGTVDIIDYEGSGTEGDDS